MVVAVIGFLEKEDLEGATSPYLVAHLELA
jgi:hypothetical protein